MYNDFIRELSELTRNHRVIIDEDFGTLQIRGQQGTTWIKWKTYPDNVDESDGEYVAIQEYNKVGKD